MTAAFLSVPVGALNLFYASQGGIAGPAAAAWLLALGSVLGSGLVWVAAKEGPWALAWGGLAFMALPVALAWPDVGVSVGGWLAMFLLAAASVAVVVASLIGSRATSGRT